MRNRIRLNESQLHKVIKESVKRVLRESKMNPIYSQTIADAYNLIKNAEKTLDKEFSKLKYKHDLDAGYTLNNFISQAYEGISQAMVSLKDTNRICKMCRDEDEEPEDWYERNEHGDFDSEY